jgi:hypothetical protein
MQHRDSGHLLEPAKNTVLKLAPHGFLIIFEAGIVLVVLSALDRNCSALH